MTGKFTRKDKKQLDELKAEIQRLENELSATRTVLEAIISGKVDAVVGTNCPYLLKAREAEEKVQKLIAEKDALIKEIHHRVKNNLQIILSLINLQMTNEKSNTIRERLLILYNRIKTMAAIHEVFYRSEYMSSLNLADYLDRIVVHLFSVYRVDENRIKLILEMEPITVSINTAIPIGMIVNELVTNSIKHAFEGLPSGSVSLRLRKLDDKECHLEITDDGKGLPPEINWERPSTLGLEIVKLLAEQIEARVNKRPGAGTSFEIFFRCH